jgi:hypothetical protein
LDAIDGFAVAEPAIAATAATKDTAKNNSSVGACRFLELIEKPLVRWFDRLARQGVTRHEVGSLAAAKDGRNRPSPEKSSKFGIS